MYKLIIDDIIVDVVKELRYVRYIPEFKKVVVTSCAAAQGICGSDGKTFYRLPNVQLHPDKSHWKIVTVIKIQENEYLQLFDALKLHKFVKTSFSIRCLQEEKIKEMSNSCREQICTGFDCVLSDNKQYHFTLKLEDQINLMNIKNELDEGAEQVIYHSTDKMCELFTAEDMLKIIQAANRHKKSNTTYFNLLKCCIKHIEDADVLKNITYGVELTSLPVSEPLKESFRRLI